MSYVAEVLSVYRERLADFSWESIAVAVNREYAKADVVLKDGDEVRCCRRSVAALELKGWNGMRVEITDEVIPSEEIVAGMKTGPDGAVCVFDGIVRDNSRGRKTLHLDYEAYRRWHWSRCAGSRQRQWRGLACGMWRCCIGWGGW